MSKAKKTIGIIAEDDSDVNCIKEIIRAVSKTEKLDFKHFVGRGCGKIKSKCKSWSLTLKTRGCTVLVLVHDLDRNKLAELQDSLETALRPFAINKTYVSIPVAELEAWLLADPRSIQKAIKLVKTPKIPTRPETIESPKEYLRDLIYKYSEKTKLYNNVKHNEAIVKEMSADVVKGKCKSFNKFYHFIVEAI